MIINKYVIHVLDKNSGIILNDYEGNSNLNIDKFIQKQVKKVMKNDLLRKAKFNDYENNLVRNCCDSIINEKNTFLRGSKEIASYLYDCLVKNDLESCDLLIASILIKNQSYVAILKLDYKILHNHKIDYEDDKFNIQMIENEIAIQNTSIKQATLIAVNTLETEYDLFVLDIDTEKIGDSSFFTKEFLDAKKIEDETYLTKEFIRLTNIWINNGVPDIVDAEQIRSIRNDMLKHNNVMDLEKFSENALDSKLEEQFKRFCESYDCKDFTIDHNVVDKKLKKRKIKTLSGFEISARLEDFEDRMKFKIERNSDGLCNLIIKNIDFLYDK